MEIQCLDSHITSATVEAARKSQLKKVATELKKRVRSINKN